MVKSISKFIPFNPFLDLPSNYKLNYGIRFSGIHPETKKPMYYGFDLFYQVNGSGLDLENFLTFCFTNDFLIDWYNFQRTSIEHGKWSYKTLIRKLSYPIIEVYGQKYWDNLNQRFMLYQSSLIQSESK